MLFAFFPRRRLNYIRFKKKKKKKTGPDQVWDKFYVCIVL